MRRLTEGARRLGLVITAEQLQQFHCYQRVLLDWNRRTNLTAITQPRDIEEFHFLDALTVALAIPGAVKGGGSLIDVGTGAGFPGLPLKVCFPAMNVTLVEATAKKVRFLEHVVDALGLSGVTVWAGRAEALAHSPDLRERFDVVVARALAPLRALAELTLPFCKVGGVGVFPKKGDVRQELAEADQAVRELGGSRPEVRAVPEEVLGGQRALVLVGKATPTPLRYPRRPGIPEKRPL